VRVDRRQRLGHAVEEGIRADEADVRMRLRLRNQVLCAAETDLQPHLIDGAWKQRAQIRGRRLGEIEPQPRQQRVEQRRLARLERVAFAPAEEGAWCIW
jgi:hypothetical protein